MEQYINELKSYFISKAEAVLKSPRGFIRYPFIDPGSIYGGNLWDWDSYWSVYGLLNLFSRAEDQLFCQKILVHARGNVRNFLDHQLVDGYIPMMIEITDLPEPYLNFKHKQGKIMNMHKPFLCMQAELISASDGDYQWIYSHLESLEKYFACYFKYYYFENSGLFVWADDVMIGMDNDPASFGRPGFSTANIFLNSFMVQELRAMARLLQKAGSHFAARSDFYNDAAEKLAAAINQECWDRRDCFYYSVDVDIKTRTFDWFHQGLPVFWKSLPIKIRVWSGFIPLWAGITDKDQAEALCKHLFDEETFASEFGITTLAKDEKMFNLSVSNNPSNWLGPIWLVANYIAFRGLLDYGYIKEARKIMEKSVLLLGRDLEATGVLHEYYDPFSGLPIMNEGFINWNLLVINMVDELQRMEVAFSAQKDNKALDKVDTKKELKDEGYN